MRIEIDFFYFRVIKKKSFKRFILGFFVFLALVLVVFFLRDVSDI